ncbi:acyl carrier protein [Actinokineospora iranica]|uniref:Phosphopantetheine attachment site n=1 Tax=Actinokineospora iranica TaxID=1271860 RepID=A0A1G6PIR5_9PSEU|nr:acyl carrier protein [Actinokineospora iranica]SDC79416.1 Phosphopantetheine attachment site [Actinokineospora iranica]
MNQVTPFIEQLTAAPLSERPTVLERMVVDKFRALLLFESTDAYPLDESYFTLGLTSLGAMDVKRQLEEQLGRSIEAATLFNNPTTGYLLAYLRSEVLADLFCGARATADHSPDSVEDDLVDDLLRDLYDG